MLRPFDVHRVAVVEQAILLRQRYGDDAAVYAGGTELLMAMKLGVARWRQLIDLKPVGSLRGVRREDGHLVVGATVTHRQLETDPIIAETLPAFALMEANVANVRVRTAGTLAGNLAFAEPHADPPTMLVALGASVVLQGGGGARTLPVGEFVTGMYQTALGQDEIITEVRIPVPPGGTRVGYVKFQILERPSVGVAIVARVRGGRLEGAPRVVVGAADEMPRIVATDGLAGAPTSDPQTGDALAEAARRAVDPVDDLAGSAEYKRHLVGVFAKRALARIAEPA